MAQQSDPLGGSAGDTSSRVELSVSCNNLKDLDFFSKSDPVVFLYERRGRDQWIKLGRTEVIDNNLNPKFSKTFVVDYRFEEIQNLKFVVYDVDNFKFVDDVQKQELIGYVDCTMADIVTSGQQYTRTLRTTPRGPPTGTITIQAEEVQDSKFMVCMQLSATNLDKKDFFGKSDPFVEIAKAQEGGTFTVVYRSQPIMKNLNPRWPQFEIKTQKLCSGDWERALKFNVWDWNMSGSHSFIGSCNTTLRDICPERGGQVFTLDLINPEIKKKKKKYTNSGKLSFNSVRAIPMHSFVDYINGGCEINLMCAIDFTASNGRPHLSTSLHYNNPQQDNEYIQAIKSVASVLAPYDSDQLIPVFGFGARLPPDGRVSHCFPLNFNMARPDVYGVQGIVEAYHYSLNQVQLYGPTNFASFLDKAIEYARGGVSQEAQNYTILLVITDGVICDMQQTVSRIVTASKLPLSIVIVGVGAADFTNMEILDADDNPLVNSRGEKMSRDIVQFVPFRQFRSKSGADFSLARETLAEIPEQFTSYMRVNAIRPNPPPLRRQESTMSHRPPPQAPSAPLPSFGQQPPPMYSQQQAPPMYSQQQPQQPPYSQQQPQQPPYSQQQPPYSQQQPQQPPYSQQQPQQPPYSQQQPQQPPYSQQQPYYYPYPPSTSRPSSTAAPPYPF